MKITINWEDGNIKKVNIRGNYSHHCPFDLSEIKSFWGRGVPRGGDGKRVRCVGILLKNGEIPRGWHYIHKRFDGWMLEYDAK